MAEEFSYRTVRNLRLAVTSFLLVAVVLGVVFESDGPHMNALEGLFCSFALRTLNEKIVLKGDRLTHVSKRTRRKDEYGLEELRIDRIHAGPDVFHSRLSLSHPRGKIQIDGSIDRFTELRVVS